MQKSLESMEIMKAMALTGNPNSASDAGVGALCARTAVKGAFMNVKINAAGIDDHAFVTNLLEKGAAIEKMAEEKEREIVTIVEQKIKELAK
jgi:glutamate formiminotransferase/formiminotetrahydrofolate cyclodeaminase